MNETLNFIITSLTTENEGLTNILVVPLAFIEITVSMLLFLQILNIPATKRQKLIYIVLISTWTMIFNLLIPKQYVVFINMVVSPFSIFFIFKTSILKSILAEFIPIIAIVLAETIIINMFYTIFSDLTYFALLHIPIYRVSSILCIYLVLFVFYLIFKQLHLNINIFDEYDKNNKRILIIAFAMGILAIAVQFYIIMFYMNNLPLTISVLSILVLLTYFLFSIYTLTRVTRLETTKRSLEESQLYNKTLQILHDNVRAFRHDFSNIIAGIGGYIQTKDIEGLEKYYSQLLIDCQSTNNLTTLSPILINNPAIYNVLANKYHKADENGIKIELSIFYDFNKLNIKIYELTRILGILLDNAIEASQECDKRIINLIVREEPKHNRKVILIENTYKNKDVNTEQIFEKGFSTKQGNTGLGLWQIRQILKKNNNLNLYTSKDDEYFRQSLEIYNQ